MKILRTDVGMGGYRVEWGTHSGYFYTRTAGGVWTLTTAEAMQDYNPVSTRNKYNDPGTSHREMAGRLAQWDPSENWIERGKAEDTRKVS